MVPVVRPHARPGDPRTTVHRLPARVLGATHLAEARDDPRGGPRPPVGRGAKEWLQAAPEPQAGWNRDVSLLILATAPPRIVLHTANVLRAAEIHPLGRDAATI